MSKSRITKVEATALAVATALIKALRIGNFISQTDEPPIDPIADYSAIVDGLTDTGVEFGAGVECLWIDKERNATSIYAGKVGFTLHSGKVRMHYRGHIPGHPRRRQVVTCKYRYSPSEGLVLEQPRMLKDG
jgi:hypothetical protein